MQTIQKTNFEAFQRAANGDQEEVKKIIEIFNNQRMIILSNTPGSSQLRKEICDVAVQLNENHAKERKYFTIGTNYYSGMVSHMNNNYISSDASQISQSLGFSEEDSPDIIKRADNPNILGYDLIEQKFLTFSRTIFLDFFKVIDQYFFNQKQDITESTNFNNKYQFIHSVALNSEVQKYRNIFLIPQKNKEHLNQQENSVPWHLDVGLATILLKEMYLVHDESSPSGYKEVQQPNCGTGLIIRDSQGNDHVISIEEDEVIIQGGISLQILSNDLLKAQAHCVRKPQDQSIGRISNTTFFYPPYNTSMETNDKNKTIEIHQTDMKVLDPVLKFSNHWKQGVKWIEFHHTQTLQYALKSYISHFKKSNNVTEDIQVNYHSFDIKQGQIKVFQFNLLDSTMEAALYWYKSYVSDKYSFAFFADQQSSGRGQKKNTWLSPKGNCYVTYLIKFKSNQAKCIPQLSAISVLDTIEQFITRFGDRERNAKPCLKWINDIHMNDKKIAGVLCSQDEDFLTIGIGVNLNQNPALDTATSLKQELNLKEDIDTIEFIRDLSVNLMNNLEEVKKENGQSTILEKVKQKLKYMNEQVIIYDETMTQTLLQGIFLGMNEYGNAILKTEEGNEVSIIQGRMRPININN